MKIALDIPLSLSEIATAVGVTFNNRDEAVRHVCTDSREVEAGDLFIAISGERRDGNDYAQGVRKAGAFVLGSRCANITVGNVNEAILKLASHYKHKLPYLKHTVAITGSVGKTTTKELTTRILSHKYHTHSSYGNFNNSLGLLHTILSAKVDTETLVVEMGMNHTGEISSLSRAIMPDVAVITNVGNAHIGNLGSREAIAGAKMEIADGMKNGALIVPYGEPLLSGTHTTSINCDGGDFALFIDGETDRATKFNFRGANLNLKGASIALKGEHLMRALSFALASADMLGACEDEVYDGLTSIAPSLLRQRRFKLGRYDIYDDTYSSSPEAAMAVIKALTSDYESKVSAVLGDMLELGDASEELHRRVGAFAAECGIRKLYLIGKLAKDIATGALSKGMAPECIFINENAKDLELTADQIQRSYDTELLIVKASHALHAERLYDFLKD